MVSLADIPDSELSLLLDTASEEELRVLTKLLADPFYSFQPRPDDPGEYEEQESFVEQNYRFDKADRQYRYTDGVKFKIQLGGTGCLAFEQPIYVHGRGWVPVGEIDRPFVTLSWDGSRHCLALANAPFVKGTAAIYRYSLSDGRSFLATAAHRVLSASGHWLSAERAFAEETELVNADFEQGFLDSASAAQVVLPSFREISRCLKASRDSQRAVSEAHHPTAIQLVGSGGQSSFSRRLLFSALRRASIGALGPLLSRQGVDCSTRTPLGFPVDCRSDYCLHGEQPRSASVADQVTVRQQDDARGCSRWNCYRDARGAIEVCSQTCQQSYLRATTDSSILTQQTRQVASQTCVFCKPSRPILDFALDGRQSDSPTSHRFHTSDAYPRLASQFDCESPSQSSLGGNECGQRIVAMEFLRQDKFYDFTVHGTHCYIAGGVVHHNSGKTTGAAHKTARHVLETPPPRDHCPFWIIAESYDQCCRVCWKEKLSEIIPTSCIAHIDYFKRGREWPFAVMLKHPQDPSRIGWILEFKSYEQGIGGMKSASIGGYWFNEEAPYSLVAEVQGRCREYDSPGWADFTPIENRDPEWGNAYESPPTGWQFYHLNTSRNFYLAEGWFDGYIQSIPEDMRELRTIGRFTTLMGAVYKEFRKSTHVIEPFRIPGHWRRIRGLDFGFNAPTACVWIAKDNDGRYYVYDEYYRGQMPLSHHAAEIHKRPWDYSQPWYGPTYSDHDPQTRGEYAILGLPLTPANKSVLIGIELIRSLMMVKGDGKPQFFVFGNCENAIKEIQGYRWPEGTDRKNPKELPIDLNDHLLDAIRYAIYTDHSRGSASAPEARRVIGNSQRHGVHLKRR